MAHTNRLTHYPQVRPEHKANLLKLGFLALLVTLGISVFSTRPGSDVAPVNDANAAGENEANITSPSDFPDIRIKNFGQMDEHFFRGAQPKPDDYPMLAKLGIKTIIDLRDEPSSYEKPLAQKVGMKYINIPMDDHSEPTDDQVGRFLAVANNAANWPFFVHCVGGRHRTGLVGAVYRFNKYGWDFDKAYREMKNYDFYTRFGHGPIKDYVEEYFKRMKAHKPFVPVADPHGAKPESEPVTSAPPPRVSD